MFKDPQFIITFQLALIGLVLIGGLFLVWKAMARIEEKVDMLIMERDMKVANPFRMELEKTGLKNNDTMYDVCQTPLDKLQKDNVMQKLFGDEQETSANGDFYIFTSPFTVPDGEDHEEVIPQDKQNDVMVEEVHAESEEPVQVSEEVAPSEVSDIQGPLSRNKLRHMNIDKLKKICLERGLDNEGTKNQLIDRILQ